MYRIMRSENSKNYQLVKYTDKWQFYKIVKGDDVITESMKLLFEAYSEQEYQMKKEILNVSDDDIEKLEICYVDNDNEIKYEMRDLDD